jgi:hypothetical protein
MEKERENVEQSGELGIENGKGELNIGKEQEGAEQSEEFGLSDKLCELNAKKTKRKRDFYSSGSNSGSSISISSSSSSSNTSSSSSSGTGITSSNCNRQISQKVRESMVSFLKGEGDNPLISTQRHYSSPTSCWNEKKILGSTHQLLALDRFGRGVPNNPSFRSSLCTLFKLKYYMIGDRRGNLKRETLFNMFVLAE